MANYRAIATGNWSNSATWDGGGVPPNAAGHNVYTNTFTVTVDQAVDVALITNASVTAAFVGGGTSAAAGGSIILSNSNNITANLTASGSVNLVSSSITGTVSITGNLTSGGSSGGSCLTHSGAGAITVTGNLTCGAGATAHCIINSGSGTITLNGNAQGSNTGAATAISNTGASGIVVVNGNVTGGSSGIGITNSSTGNVTITGNVTASTTAGISNTSTGTITLLSGTYTATNSANAVTSTNASSVVRASGSFIYSANGTVPINTPKFILNTAPTFSKTRYALNGSGTYVDMFTADNSLGQPVPADVRLGTVYASGSLTGTLAVPAVGSVALGVPVDATFGTAVLTASAIRAELSPELTQISETHLIHGLKTGSPLNVTPTARTAGAISQTITGDGVTTTTVTR